MKNEPSNLTLYCTLIEQAVLNKYSNQQIGDLELAVCMILTRVGSFSEAALLADVRVLKSPLDDLHNQVIVLELIERFWSRDRALRLPLQIVHRCLFGPETGTSLRQTEDVEDYGGTVATPHSEVPARLDELERLCEYFIVELGGSGGSVKASALALIYSSVIRIHPFTDGNGRTARMFVYYALRCWGMNLIAIPKVRNDLQWKSALGSAIAGDLSSLRRAFLERLNQEAAY